MTAHPFNRVGQMWSLGLGPRGQLLLSYYTIFTSASNTSFLYSTIGYRHVMSEELLHPQWKAVLRTQCPSFIQTVLGFL